MPLAQKRCRVAQAAPALVISEESKLAPDWGAAGSLAPCVTIVTLKQGGCIHSQGQKLWVGDGTAVAHLGIGC